MLFHPDRTIVYRLVPTYQSKSATFSLMHVPVMNRSGRVMGRGAGEWFVFPNNSSASTNCMNIGGKWIHEVATIGVLICVTLSQGMKGGNAYCACTFILNLFPDVYYFHESHIRSYLVARSRLISASLHSLLRNMCNHLLPGDVTILCEPWPKGFFSCLPSREFV